MGKMDIVFAGLGGQGVMTLLQVLALAASRDSIPVKYFEGTGMTQRGGGVFGFVRLGPSHSPRIPLGEADAIVSLELAEMASVIAYLRPFGQVWGNVGKVPGYYARLHPESYPLQEEIEALVRIRTPHLHLIPASRLAEEAGSPQAVNMVMLGAFCRKSSVLRLDSVTWSIGEVNKKFAPSNLEAFWKGYAFFEAAPLHREGGISLLGNQ